jgi:hypothetical protein
MLEEYNLVMINPSIKGFLWHFFTNFPAPAQILVICSLRQRTTGELADKAWHIIEKLHENREFLKDKYSDNVLNSNSALYFAMANLTLKAWDARMTDLQSHEPNTPTPRFISQFRHQLATKKGNSPVTPSNSLANTTQPESSFGDQGAKSYQNFDPSSFLLAPGYTQHQMGGLPLSASSSGWDIWDIMQGDVGSMQNFDDMTQISLNQS